MQNIGAFFERFKNRAAQEVMALSFIIDVVKKHSGITLELKDISLSNGILRLKLSSLQKNVIYIKKAQILKDLEKLPDKKVSDIQ